MKKVLILGGGFAGVYTARSLTGVVSPIRRLCPRTRLVMREAFRELAAQRGRVMTRQGFFRLRRGAVFGTIELCLMPRSSSPECVRIPGTGAWRIWKLLRGASGLTLTREAPVT